jgi:regulator of sirC expression with transglutaminase-like and TPR domain
VVDPINGRSLSREELSERLEPYRQEAHEDDAVPLGLYLQMIPARDIVARMLRNLKEIHRTQEDWGRLLAVQDRLLVLLPQAWDEYRDRGLTHAELGQAAPAIHDLETYLFHAKAAADSRAIAERLAGLRRGLNSDQRNER